MHNLIFNKIIEQANDPSLSEDGGKHGTQGGNFQKAWAIARIFELEMEGVGDFLFLFESLQDVTELDSEDKPTYVKIYQVKKKERGEWSWNELTGYKLPGGKVVKTPNHEKFRSAQLEN